jgi:uncharacterized protein (DUF433 family)
MSTAVTYQYLERRPQSVYRQLFIKGTGIMAEVIYRACTALDELHTTDDPDPRTPDQVAQDYGLPIQAVLEAIDYCRTYPPEIAADRAREDRVADASGMNHPNYKHNPRAYYRPLSPQQWAELSRDETLSR